MSLGTGTNSRIFARHYDHGVHPCLREILLVSVLPLETDSLSMPKRAKVESENRVMPGSQIAHAIRTALIASRLKGDCHLRGTMNGTRQWIAGSSNSSNWDRTMTLSSCLPITSTLDCSLTHPDGNPSERPVLSSYDDLLNTIVNTCSHVAPCQSRQATAGTRTYRRGRSHSMCGGMQMTYKTWPQCKANGKLAQSMLGII